MSKLASGWEIVCPDGARRHLPYHNLGDAECDGRLYSTTHPCEHWDEGQRATKCPGGQHKVEPIVFDDTPREGGGLN